MNLGLGNLVNAIDATNATELSLTSPNGDTTVDSNVFDFTKSDSSENIIKSNLRNLAQEIDLSPSLYVSNLTSK